MPEKIPPYITEEGYQILQDELSGLWKHRRTVTEHLAAAAAEGDRSENAEYIYRKKELRQIDRRIRYLQKRLPDLQVIRNLPGDKSKVFFGATVTLKNENDTQEVFRIVGTDEISHQSKHISIQSPLASALLKKSIGDQVKITTPAGTKQYQVLNISY